MNITPIEQEHVAIAPVAEPPIIPPDPWDALPPRIQAKVLDDHRLDEVEYWDWWDILYDDFTAIAETLCIGIADQGKNGKAIDFQSYPWGCSFDGMYGPIVYRAPAQEQFSLARLLIRAEYPGEAELHRIADGLYEVQARNGWAIVAQVESIGRSTHSRNTSIDVQTEIYDERPYEYQELSDSDAEEISQLLRDFMDWMSERLEAEYDYLTSDEYIVERVREGVIDLSEYTNQEEDDNDE